jgi:hypothetical protein
MMHALTLVLLTIALVCDPQEVRSGSLAEFLVAGSAIVALVVHDLLRDRRAAAPTRLRARAQPPQPWVLK